MRKLLIAQNSTLAVKRQWELGEEWMAIGIGAPIAGYQFSEAVVEVSNLTKLEKEWLEQVLTTRVVGPVSYHTGA